MHRFVDDLAACCTCAAEARVMLEDLQRILLPTGKKLKDDDPETVIFDLADVAAADYLGFHLQGDACALSVQIGDAAYRPLEVRLENVYEQPHPSITADQVIRGWLAQQEPCFSDSDRLEVYQKLGRICRGSGFEETPSEAGFEQQWVEA